MAQPTEPHLFVVVESFLPASTAGLHGEIHVRPVAGQGNDTAMHVRCPKALGRDHPLGTRFRIRAKLTDREGGKPFLSTHHSWPYEVL